MDKKQEADFEYNVDYRNVKHPRLEFKTGSLLLILPKSYKSEKETLEKHKEWIQKKKTIISRALEEAQAKNLKPARTETELRSIIQILTQNYQRELDTQIGKVYFKKMKTKWASHSHNNNLTVNTLLRYMPDNLIEYVIFHEVAHSKHGRKHNEEFWRQVSKKFKDYPQREKELLVYWFIIQKREHGQGPPERVTS